MTEKVELRVGQTWQRGKHTRTITKIWANTLWWVDYITAAGTPSYAERRRMEKWCSGAVLIKEGDDAC